MYHLLRGFHEYLTRKDEFSIVIIGLDNVSRVVSCRVATGRALTVCTGGQDGESWEGVRDKADVPVDVLGEGEDAV